MVNLTTTKNDVAKKNAEAEEWRQDNVSVVVVAVAVAVVVVVKMMPDNQKVISYIKVFR